MTGSTVDYSDPQGFGDKVFSYAAEMCYELADAMLAERGKNNGT